MHMHCAEHSRLHTAVASIRCMHVKVSTRLTGGKKLSFQIL